VQFLQITVLFFTPLEIYNDTDNQDSKLTLNPWLHLLAGFTFNSVVQFHHNVR